MGAEGLDEPLRCDLSVSNLDEKPQYTALSYVWGVMAPIPDTVVCGGVLLPVTANALSALRNLRTKLGGFTIWIDVVCINQLDESEKSHQLPLMGEIYDGATTSYFWLGDSMPPRQKAMNFLSQTGFVQFYFRNKTSFSDIDHLLDCVWVTRIWTYQEVAMARSPVIVCGQSHIPWNQSSLSIIFLGRLS
ncbi:HET-domain-containing protein [Ophiobolus disseminans]|uniref:HET-domain-containing protein n=1 Tax=Ophiobolus disseminans TaxID=1469910 RepID=A0A6A6ZDM9_9PLEO|nr:HET-domain-containing protein [Ophiobolus disseminans]